MEELPYHKRLEVLLLIKQGKVPTAVSIVHHELGCGLLKAKRIVDDFKK